MNAVVAVNIDVNDQDKVLYFQHNGWWYEYFTGDSININGNTNMTFNPGEYRVYTDLRLDKPTIQNTLNIEDIVPSDWEINLYPNPSTDFINVNATINSNKPIIFTILNSEGKVILYHNEILKDNLINIEKLKRGKYFLIIRQNNQIQSKEFIKI